MTVNIVIEIDGVDVSPFLTDAYPTMTHTENHGRTIAFSCMKTILPSLSLNLPVVFKNDNVTLFLGNIVSFSPQDEVVEIVAGDAMNKLKGLGANYYYTHYRTRVIDKPATDGVSTDNRLYLNIKDGATIDTEPPPMYAVNNDPYNLTTESGATHEASIHFGKSQGVVMVQGPARQRFRVTNKFLYGISLRGNRVPNMGGVRFTLCNDAGNNSPGSEIYSVEVRNPVTVNGYIDFMFSPIEVDTSKSYWFVLDNVSNPAPDTNYTIFPIRGNSGLPTNDNYLDATGNTIFVSPQGGIYFLPQAIQGTDWSIPMKVHSADYRRILNGVSSGSRFYINEIEGLGTTFPTTIRNPVFTRGLVSYYDGTVQISDILAKSLDAHNLVLNPSGSVNGLLKYKCRGSYLATYVEDLTAMIESNGDWVNHQTVMSASFTDDSLFYLKKRKNINDAEDMTLRWGSDPIISFTPTKTMTNRPSVQYIRSEVKNPAQGEPPIIMVSAVDLNSPLYTSEALIDSGFVFASDAFVQGYATLDDTARNAWEGTMAVAGIIDVFDTDENSDTFGSGKIIRVIRNDYGINEKMKVKKATWNFDNWTTTITFTNVPEFTNPRISNLDRDRIQSQSTALSLGDTEGYLCLIKADMTSQGLTGTNMELYHNATPVALLPFQVITATRYNTVTYHAYFPPGTGTVIAEHSITAIKVGNRTIQLKESQYQDKYAEQGLTVDVIMRID